MLKLVPVVHVPCTLKCLTTWTEQLCHNKVTVPANLEIMGFVKSDALAMSLQCF